MLLSLLLVSSPEQHFLVAVIIKCSKQFTPALRKVFSFIYSKKVALKLCCNLQTLLHYTHKNVILAHKNIFYQEYQF